MKIKELRKQVKELYDKLPNDFRKSAFAKWDMNDIENMPIVEFMKCYKKTQEVCDVIKLLSGVTK